MNETPRNFPAMLTLTPGDTSLALSPPLSISCLRTYQLTGGGTHTELPSLPSLDWLKNSIPGEPGVDYPIMASVAETSFSCDGLIFGGYYADPETQCQQYSVCLQVRPSDL